MAANFFFDMLGVLQYPIVANFLLDKDAIAKATVSHVALENDFAPPLLLCDISWHGRLNIYRNDWQLVFYILRNTSVGV